MSEKHEFTIFKGSCSMMKITYSGDEFHRKLGFDESNYYFYKKDPTGNDVYRSHINWYLWFNSRDSQWLVSINGW